MKKDIFPIGIGTWGIGGFAKKDKSSDEKSIEAVRYSISKGMNFIEVNYWTAEGHSVELVSEAIKRSGVLREKIFLHQALYSYNNDTLDDVKNEMNIVRELFCTDYMDSIEFDITGINKYGFDEVVEFVKEALESGEARYISLTNSDIDTLKKFKEIFSSSFFGHELNFNFELRENEEWGVIRFAEDHDIKNILYQPLRRNRTADRNWELLVELSEKYNKTQNQILINWFVSKGFLPLVKSNEKEHINENIEALNFKINPEDIKRMDDFRPEGWKTPEIVFDNAEINDNNVVIHQLSNVFDDIYEKMKR